MYQLDTNGLYSDFTESFSAINDSVPFYGYSPDAGDIQRFTEQEQQHASLSETPHFASMLTEQRDAFLWLPLIEQLPNWVRGNQGIGDCVSWGWELACTMFLFGLRKLGQADCPLVTGATEPIYGGSRVEARGGRLGGYSDGSYGAAAARWLAMAGFLLRLNYSKETGSADDDLTKYDKSKAKAWGNFGNGGKDDSRDNEGALDQIASRFPVTTTAIKTLTEGIAALMNGYPIPVCSSVGFGRMRRDSQGVVRRSGRWMHCMLIAGLRWVKGKPQFRLFQSWGKSCSGPDPGVDHEPISWCSWWITAEDFQAILRAGDSFAVTGQEGFVPRKLDWTEVRSHIHNNIVVPDWVLAV